MVQTSFGHTEREFENFRFKTGLLKLGGPGALASVFAMLFGMRHAARNISVEVFEGIRVWWSRGLKRSKACEDIMIGAVGMEGENVVALALCTFRLKVT